MATSPSAGGGEARPGAALDDVSVTQTKYGAECWGNASRRMLALTPMVVVVGVNARQAPRICGRRVFSASRLGRRCCYLSRC